MTSDIVYMALGSIGFLLSMVLIGRTELWQDEVLDDDFFLYIMGWFLRFLVSILVGFGWPVVLPGAVLVGFAWIAWCNQKQRKHVKRWGYEDDDYDWKAKLIPERFQKEKEDQH